ERAASPATLGGQPTVQERISTQAAPTVVESKWKEAEPTVLERKVAPPKKSKVVMISSIAAAAVIVVAIAAFVMFRPPTKIVQKNPISVPSGGTVTTTPIPTGQGQLLLSASPWGEIDKIVNEKSKKIVDLNDDDRSTPKGIDLEPGKYLITMTGPKGQTTVEVQIDPGKRVKKTIDLGGVDLDELQKEVTKQ